MTSQPSRYSEETAKEILKRAIDLQGDHSEADFSREQLLDMARDLGISEASLAKAEQNWLAEQTVSEEERMTVEERAAFERHRTQEFRTHLATYLIVNTFLFIIYLVTGASHPWFIYPLLGWGIGVAIHAVTSYQQDGYNYEQELIQWRAKRKELEASNRRLLQ
jgi:hypothetical protein